VAFSHHFFVLFRAVQVIKTREESNPAFSFLFDLEGAEGQYYRWRTYGERVWVCMYVYSARCPDTVGYLSTAVLKQFWRARRSL
jgi:hypothetical protein